MMKISITKAFDKIKRCMVKAKSKAIQAIAMKQYCLTTVQKSKPNKMAPDIL